MYASNEKRNAYLKEYRRGKYFQAYKVEYLKKTAEQRKKWAAEYYKRNKKKITQRVLEYRQKNPEKVVEWTEQYSKKSKARSKKDRQQLKPHYIKALIKEEGSNKNVDQKTAEVLIKRIKKLIKEKRK